MRFDAHDRCTRRTHRYVFGKGAQATHSVVSIQYSCCFYNERMVVVIAMSKLLPPSVMHPSDVFFFLVVVGKRIAGWLCLFV